MKKNYCLLIFIFFFFGISNAQQDNLPIDHRVYSFLKEMRVKRILNKLQDDFLVLSRSQIISLLNEVERKSDLLSTTEKKLLEKFKYELTDELNSNNSSVFFTSDKDVGQSFLNLLTNKKKYLYGIIEDENSFFVEGLGNFYHGQKFSPTPVTNSNLYDIGFRVRGTVFNKLGYNLTVIKGGVSGNALLAEKVEPRLLSNFKWVEKLENIGNYGFNYGYLKLNLEPYPKMFLSLQLGREDIAFGYGYGNKLIISGNNPTLDFISFNFSYGVFNLFSLHASTVGEFLPKREDRFTKYIAINKMKFAFDNLEFGIGESMIYSGRGIELGYLSPISFYKFVEMDIQDRDNGNVFLELKTNPIDNLEIQGTFFLDENILSNLQYLDKYTNKTAYQIGLFLYNPLRISDLSLIAEYTKIRPFVYTHINPQNTYTSFGRNLGHWIGPNADEIILKLAYNINEYFRIWSSYSFVRKGKNIYDANGNLVKNVGGDVYLSHPDEMPNKTALFLDGERWNYRIFTLALIYEPINEIIIELSLISENAKKIATTYREYLNYGFLRLKLSF
jgi:hypothetical protein